MSEEIGKRKRGRPRRFDPSFDRHDGGYSRSRLDPNGGYFPPGTTLSQPTHSEEDKKTNFKRVRGAGGKFIFTGGRKRVKKNPQNPIVENESESQVGVPTDPSKTLLFKLSEAREQIFGGIDDMVSAASNIYDELEKLEEENEALKKRIEELEHVEATADKIREWQKKIMHLSKFMDESVGSMNTNS